MKNKTLFLTSLMCLSFYSFSQNITLEKTLDNTIELDRDRFYDYPKRKNTQYWKVKENQILRFEEDKLQLFNSDFDKVWEVDIPKIKSPLNENTYIVRHNDKHIYVYQTAYHGVQKKTQSKLTIVDYDGERREKSISDVIKINDLKKQNMKIINDELFLFVVGFRVNDPDKKSNYYALKFDEEGDLIKEYDITSGNEQNKGIKWFFSKIENEKIVLKRRFYQVGVRRVQAYSSKSTISYENILVLDSDLNPISNRIIETPNPTFIKGRYQKERNIAIKYDTETTSMKLDGVELIEQRDFSYTTEFDKLELNVNGVYTDRIIEDVIELCGKKLYAKTKGKIRFVDATTDPINGGINLFLNIRFKLVKAGQKCLVTLDENLKVVKIEVIAAYTFEDTIGDLSKPNKNISFEYFTHRATFGEFSAHHKINALDYCATNGEKNCLYTVVNYPDYQLLFVDNRLTKESKVLKFEK